MEQKLFLFHKYLDCCIVSQLLELVTFFTRRILNLSKLGSVQGTSCFFFLCALWPLQLPAHNEGGMRKKSQLLNWKAIFQF